MFHCCKNPSSKTSMSHKSLASFQRHHAYTLEKNMDYSDIIGWNSVTQFPKNLSSSNHSDSTVSVNKWSETQQFRDSVTQQVWDSTNSAVADELSYKVTESSASQLRWLSSKLPKIHSIETVKYSEPFKIFRFRNFVTEPKNWITSRKVSGKRE